MSAAYVVIYEGAPEDPEAFLSYYLEHHLPIVRTWPGLRGVEILRGAEADDPFLERSGDVFMIARFNFDSLADLRTALRSDGRRQAREDFHRLPAFAGRVRHQAVEVQPA